MPENEDNNQYPGYDQKYRFENAQILNFMSV